MAAQRLLRRTLSLNSGLGGCCSTSGGRFSGFGSFRGGGAWLRDSSFLIGCLEYAYNKPEEHLIIGYGFRHGSTTKIESLHHII
jgi:hypothetical protein